MKSLLVALLLGATAFAQPLPSGYLPVPGDVVLESNLVFETNAARGQMGLSQLEQDPGLIAAARQHALEMATMDYFGHTSPVPEHETVAHRLTKTGSPLVTVGENLALLQGQPDLAKAAIAGWLESPGHRENLLNSTFTHVGFGTAVNGRDETVIVQVLAYIPVRLVGFDIQTEAIDTTSVTIVARASATVSSLLSIGGTSTPPRTLEPGDHELSLELVDPQSERYHIRIGASLAGQEGYILQDAGWLDIGSGTWSRDPLGSRQVVEIAGMRVATSRADATRIRFQYQQTSSTELAVFLAQEHLPGVITDGGTIDLLVPASAVGVPVQIGVVEGTRVAIFHAFELRLESGRIRLAPASP